MTKSLLSILTSVALAGALWVSCGGGDKEAARAPEPEKRGAPGGTLPSETLTETLAGAPETEAQPAEPSARPNAEPPKPSFELRFVEGKLSLRAEKAPLREILKRITVESGVRISLESVGPDLVTDSFSELPLETAIKRLAGGHNLVFLYKRDKANPEISPLQEVRIAAKREGARDQPVTEGGEGSAGGEANVDEVIARLSRAESIPDRNATILELGMLGGPKAQEAILPFLV
ncbi:MAG: hypothetical protein ACRD1Z_17455, partial [Vicinamibacteria bacterium]